MDATRRATPVRRRPPIWSVVAGIGILLSAALWAASMPASDGSANSPSQLAQAEAGGVETAPVTEFERAGKISGYRFSTPETRRLQDHDDDNPGFLWVERGEAMWVEPAGADGKSCASCHGKAASMRGVGATYPKVSKETGRLFTLEHQVNYCRTERMKSAALVWNSDDLLAITAFVMHQSRGLPLAVATDGPAAPFFERGAELYRTRRGQLNAACEYCHVRNSGNHLRADLLSEGHINGFPLFRLGWQRMGSVHAQMETCYELVRATPEPYGSDELTALQLFLAWRSNGLLVETPAVRR
ncbi:MAG: sulfur oxidation c-type cytochrome SoxA [Proteobacteria bacterium]|nr:sulfur oxidation c-type cytochrome SoxA [Pseudomonadota bacterium]